MQFRALVAVAIALGTACADNGPLEVVYPRVCGRVCGPVVTQSQGNCLQDDLSCICYQPHMQDLIPRCQACAANAKDTKNGGAFLPSINDLLRTCDLKTTSITLGAAAPTAMPVLGVGAAAAFAAYAAL